MILVVGGTGDLGRRVTRILLAQEQDVRCLVRPGSDDSALRALGAETVRGDLTDPESLVSACQDVTVVVATATVIGRRLAGARRPTIHEVDEVGMASLVSAAERAGAERYIHLSFPGVENAIGTPMERAKIAIEERLRRSSLREVVIRSDAFQEIHFAPTARFDVMAGKVSIIGRGDNKRRWVSTEDIAALIGCVAIEPDPPSLITVGGPEALTKNEAVALAEEATGRPIKVQHMPRAMARLAVRVLNRPNDALASVFGAGLLQDLQPATWDDEPLRQRGIQPKPASDFIREQVGA